MAVTADAVLIKNRKLHLLHLYDFSEFNSNVLEPHLGQYMIIINC